MFCDSETRMVIYLMLYTHTCPKQTSKRLFSTISRFFFEIWMFRVVNIYDASSFFFFRWEHSFFFVQIEHECLLCILIHYCLLIIKYF